MSKLAAEGRQNLIHLLRCRSDHFFFVHAQALRIKCKLITSQTTDQCFFIIQPPEQLAHTDDHLVTVGMAKLIIYLFEIIHIQHDKDVGPLLQRSVSLVSPGL